SGYLITRLLVGEYNETGRIALVAFYERRARRLLPALSVFLVLLLAVAAGALVAGKISNREMAGAMIAGCFGALYCLNLAVAWHMFPPIGGWIVHLWSLAQEEQFYILWPITLALGLRLHRRTLLLLLAVSIGVAEWHQLATLHAGFDRVYYAPDTHAVPL